MNELPQLPADIFHDAAHQTAFARDGYVVVDLLDERDLAQLRTIWESYGADVRLFPFSSTIMSQDLAYRHEVHRRVAEVLAPRIQQVVRGYRFCLGSFVAKQPKVERSRVEMHQDWWFVDERRFWSLGFWCPLVDVEPRNGCLQALPGSHLINRRPRGYPQGFAYEALVPHISASYLVDVPMRAGQAFVSTQSLIHCSPPNQSDTERVAATGLAIPEQSTLLYLCGERGMPDDTRLQVHEVADDFYVGHIYGIPPAVGTRIGVVDGTPEPLSTERLRELFGPGREGVSS